MLLLLLKVTWLERGKKITILQLDLLLTERVQISECRFIFIIEHFKLSFDYPHFFPESVVNLHYPVLPIPAQEPCPARPRFIFFLSCAQSPETDST